MNKKSILRFAMVLFALATILGLITFSGLVESDKTANRTIACATIFGIMGISALFIGDAYPKD